MISSWWGKPKGLNTEREKLLFCNFDQYEVENKTRKCITLVYPLGYQIWDITSLDHIFEIYSVKGSPSLKIARMIPTPAAEEPEDAPFYNGRPLIVLTKDDETNAKSSSLLITSLRDQEVIPIKIKGKITNILCNKHAICLVSEIINIII